jgi:phosphoglycolate phosphatase
MHGSRTAQEGNMDLRGAVIVFDLDGTLVDTAPDLIGALNEVLDQAALPALPVESARHLVGRGAQVLIERGFAAAGEPLDALRAQVLVERFVSIYRRRIARESAPFEGLEAALDELAAAGAAFAVCTNKRTDLSLALLDALRLTTRFQAIVGADQAVQKPDPRLLFLAIERAGGSPDRALYVGDSIVDLKTARAANIPIAGVSFGYSDEPLRPDDFDAFIDRFADLPGAAVRLLA